MGTFKGLVYVKHGRIGSKSEGPDYYLQTWDQEYLLKYADRNLWELDYYLEFFCRKFVDVDGKISKEIIGGKEVYVLYVESITKISESYIPRPEMELKAKIE
ncbi:hypothetical protein ACSAZK_03125 [Methanosarcina sp. Mfa9]|uniref:hypothetical protein n=1 Tax=Methanosarcina sp. Mfa9 TaxID=3439063 RepID=UPI003F82EF70